MDEAVVAMRAPRGPHKLSMRSRLGHVVKHNVWPYGKRRWVTDGGLVLEVSAHLPGASIHLWGGHSGVHWDRDSDTHQWHMNKHPHKYGTVKEPPLLGFLMEAVPDSSLPASVEFAK